MFMQFVQVDYKPGSLEIIQRIYNEKIIPRLREIPGCLYAGLIKGEENKNEGISMTLWDSSTHAEEYELSGVYKELLSYFERYLQDSSEWKIELSKDMQLEYKPVGDEAIVKSLNMIAQSNNKILDNDHSDLLYVRIVSLTIKPGNMEEFETIYKNDVMPVLQKEKGCRYFFLAKNVDGKNEAISVTIWDSKEDAEYYEKEGHYKELLKKLEHTLGDLFHWKMALEKEYKGKVSTSDDLSIEYYSVVKGQSFH